MKVIEDPQPAPAPGPDADPQGSWLRRYGLALALGALGFFAGVYVLWVVGPKGLMGFGPQSPVAAPTSSGIYGPIIDHIYEVTNQALQQRDVDLLASVYDTRCQCYQQAKQEIQQLLANHQVLGGAGSTVIRVEIEAAHNGTALIGVTDKLPPFPVLDEQGKVVQQMVGQPSEAWTITLEERNGTWLVKDWVPQINSLP